MATRSARSAGLDAISEHLRAADAQQLDDLRTKLRIGLHRDVEVTEAPGENRPVVSQAFCSALPVAYGSIALSHWKAFACLVLEGAYEATLWGAVLNAQRGASNVAFLTSLGGAAFGNDESWLIAGMRRALEMMRKTALEAKLVSYGAPPGLSCKLRKSSPDVAPDASRSAALETNGGSDVQPHEDKGMIAAFPVQWYFSPFCAAHFGGRPPSNSHNTARAIEQGAAFSTVALTTPLRLLPAQRFPVVAGGQGRHTYGLRVAQRNCVNNTPKFCPIRALKS
jgi:hypothetical protein